MFKKSPKRRGQALIEYALLIAMLLGIFTAGVVVIKQPISSLFCGIGNVIPCDSASGAPTSPPGGPTPTPPTFPPPRVKVNPPNPPDGPVTPTPTATVNCSGFTPGASVDITFTPEGIGPTSVLATTTADTNGNVVDFVVNIPADAQGNYVFGCRGTGGGGDSPPIKIGELLPTDPPLPSPIASAATMSVMVNSCSSAYVRSQPTVNSSAVALLPAGSGPLTVYVTPLTGGSWGAPPNTPWYTCDGQGQTWYQIVGGNYDGDYIFTGGVHEFNGTTALGTLLGTLTITIADGDGWAYDSLTTIALPVGQKVVAVLQGSTAPLTHTTINRWYTPAGDGVLLWQLVNGPSWNRSSALFDSASCVATNSCVDGGYQETPPWDGVANNYAYEPMGELGIAVPAYVGLGPSGGWVAVGTNEDYTLSMVCRSGGVPQSCFGPAGTVYTLKIYAAS
jgi:hypothetical protein